MGAGIALVLASKWPEHAVVFLALSTDTDDDWKNKRPAHVKKNGFEMPVGRSTENLDSARRAGDIPSFVVDQRDSVVRRHVPRFALGSGDRITKEIAAALGAR